MNKSLFKKKIQLHYEKLKEEFGVGNYVPSRAGLNVLGLKSHSSFYTYILKPLEKEGLVDLSYRGTFKIIK